MSWSEFLAYLVPFIVAILGLWIRQLYEKQTELAKQLDGPRREFAKEALNFIFKVIAASKTGRNANIKPEDMYALYKGLMLFGSDKTVNTYNIAMRTIHLRQAAGKQDADLALTAVEHFGDFMLSLRKDVGHKGTKLKRGDLLQLFITDYDEAINKK